MGSAAVQRVRPASPGPSPRSRIEVPYADSRAQDLSYALGLAALPALKVQPVAVGGLEVVLRILGGSHQVLVAADGRRLVSETVACLPSDGRATGDGRVPLPAEHEAALPPSPAGRMKYRMTSRVAALDASPAAVESLMATLDDAPTGVLGVFPGHPQAFTGLRVLQGTGSVEWRSWHAYPQTNELVLTRSRLAMVPA